jgi:hypothetical protein
MEQAEASVTTTAAVDLSTVSTSALASELGRRSWQERASRQIFSPCKFCGLPYGVRAMKTHIPTCTRNPTRRSLRRKLVDNAQ